MPRRDAQIRQCALTRESKPVTELLRFALGPDDILVPDVDGKAPGRGVWISLSWAAVDQAVRKKVFARSLHQAIKVTDALADLTAMRLEQRLSGAMGLARKAGQAITGATRVRAAIVSGSVLALFTAQDAAVDGRDKMVRTLRAGDDENPVPHFELLTSSQLGLALGQENVIHAALGTGAAAKSALVRAQRLALFLADAIKDETNAI